MCSCSPPSEWSKFTTCRAVLFSTRSDEVVLAITAGATIEFDLILAVELGIALAAILALLKIAKSASAVKEPVTFDGIDDTVEATLLRDRIVCYRIDGALFFGAAQRFLTELTAVTNVSVVILASPTCRCSTQPAPKPSQKSSPSSRPVESPC